MLFRSIGVSVDLKGLHMASDRDFNKKSFTTGHTGFGIPFATWPDRSDVPRSAARPLRYLDRYVLVKQGEVFYTTEALSSIEGLERGPAGNTSLAAAFKIASEMREDQILVVQETEYTGAGKNPSSQITFARQNGIEIIVGDPNSEVPGKNIVIPKDLSLIDARDVDLNRLKLSYIKNCIENINIDEITEEDITFLSQDIKEDKCYVENILSGGGLNEKGR